MSSSAAAESQMDPVDGGHSHGMAVKPIGVDVPKTRKSGTGGSVTLVAVLSSVIAFAVCLGIIWIFFLKYGCFIKEHPHVIISSHGKIKISGTYIRLYEILLTLLSTKIMCLQIVQDIYRIEEGGSVHNQCLLTQTFCPILERLRYLALMTWRKQPITSKLQELSGKVDLGLFIQAFLKIKGM